ncbi:hypothetical protein MYCTH_2302201 [Thermothelomyces thermophilus ATCC 42464]|uniref:Uncharacterized protein n=1 Tax=Thermothelomyces thermophilus (strain ATCC 42464 / BCRC 31852 / DSM 1799) TaxID=573729 RepID=G2QB91_THET4|nr:uncharacterized protein MYCTH_2302201 [Thermothelomyces thermophilus ATCC 42464]AEO56830.1 hypothetical protein MYCTH_2302201 [Thermothelomyces thermophilus ATCC 42464]
MNTVKSFWMGWGSLCVAGGAAYYFAKKNINADRQSRLEEQRRKKAMIESLEYSENVPNRPLSSATTGGSNGSPANGGPARTDTAGSPSQESSSDPAPTRHAPATESQRVLEKSKYEASVPFRSPKGDRFS